MPYGSTEDPVTLKVILSKPDITLTHFDTVLSPDQYCIEVRQSDVPVVTDGDTFTIGSKVYTAFGESIELLDRAVWRVNVRCA